jgi:hypothetical protein
VDSLFSRVRPLKHWGLTFYREAGAVILKIAYGYTIDPRERDLLVHISNAALDIFSKAATPGAWLVDMIPARMYIPFLM